MKPTRLALLLLPLSLAACIPGMDDKPQRPAALEGLTPLATTEKTLPDPGGLAVTAGDLSVTLPPAWMPLRIANQVTYQGLATGHTMRVTAMESAQPMDRKRQLAVLEAMGSMVRSAERLISRFGGGEVGQPRVAPFDGGVTARFEAKGPLQRAAAYLVVVTERHAVSFQIETSQPTSDGIATMVKVLGSVRHQGKPLAAK